MLKTATSVAALTMACGIAAALAQSDVTQQGSRPTSSRPTSVAKAPVPGQIVLQDANTILAKDLIGLTLYQPDKTSIGKITDLILSHDAKTVEGVVVGVGGFLGIGEKSVALKLDRLQMNPDPKEGLHLTVDVKKDELAEAPSFKSKREQDAERQAAELARQRPQTPMPGAGVPQPGTK